MTAVIIRNPAARWAVWLFFAAWALLGVLYRTAAVATDCAGQGACAPASRILPAFGALASTSPFLIVFLAAALAARRARITLSDEGIEARGALGRDYYAWRDIAHVSNGTDISLGGNTMGRGQAAVHLVLTDGTEVRLPAPRSFGRFGRSEFDQQAGRVFEEWRRHHLGPASQ